MGITLDLHHSSEEQGHKIVINASVNLEIATDPKSLNVEVTSATASFDGKELPSATLGEKATLIWVDNN